MYSYEFGSSYRARVGVASQNGAFSHAMAPLYEVVILTKTGTEATTKLKNLLATNAKMLWERGAVIADIKPWGQRELAYRIRKQQKNYYNAQYTSLHVYCNPATLSTLETNLRQNDHVLRWMPLKMDHVTPLDDATRFPNRPSLDTSGPVDLEADPAEAMRWEYRNLVMQRVFEGRTKQELIAEQLVRHRFQRAQSRAPPKPAHTADRGPLIAALRDASPPELADSSSDAALPPPGSDADK